MNRDILCIIFSFVDCGSDYKSISLVCVEWSNIVKHVFPYANVRFANQLMQLLKLFPNAKWNYFSVSKNINITWKLVCDNPQIPWDYRGLSMNKNITWEIIRINSDKPWDYFYVSKNPNITWEIACKNVNYPWDYPNLISGKIMKINGIAVTNTPHASNTSSISFLRDIISFERITENKYNNNTLQLEFEPINLIGREADCDNVSADPTLTWDVVYDNPNFPWNFSLLSMNDFK